jgi:hypothetical protein
MPHIFRPVYYVTRFFSVWTRKALSDDGKLVNCIPDGRTLQIHRSESLTSLRSGGDCNSIRFQFAEKSEFD